MSKRNRGSNHGSYLEGLTAKQKRIQVTVDILTVLIVIGGVLIAGIGGACRLMSTTACGRTDNVQEPSTNEMYHTRQMVAYANIEDDGTLTSIYETVFPELLLPEDDLPGIDEEPSIMTLSAVSYAMEVPPVPDVVEDALPAEDERPVVQASRMGLGVYGYDPDVDYSAMIQDVYGMIESNPENVEHLLGLCEIYEIQRNLKIEDMYGEDSTEKTDYFSAGRTLEEIDALLHPHIPYMEYTQAEADKLAALIYAEAGSSWLSDYHQLCVGSVPLCRLASEDWPYWTLFDVIYAPGQYPNTCDATYYDERAYNNAIYLLENGPVVEAYYQGNRREGGSEDVEVFRYPDHPGSTTYITK